MSDQNKGRIAIEFGGGGASSSSSSKPTSRPPPPSSLGKRPRAHHALGGASDSESDDDHHRGRHEAITGFGAEGAETERKRREAKEARREFVIERQPNKDWRAEAKAQRQSRHGLPAEARAAQQNGANSAETEPADQDKGLQWGLTIKKKSDEDAGTPSPGPEATAEKTVTNGSTEEAEKPAESTSQPRRTEDDEAMDALLGNKPKEEKTIIQAPPPSEDDVYKRDAAEAGVASTLEDYEAMPVEEFGAALLRGMGWDGKHRGQVKEARRRANRLGLGAKELKEAEDLGGWNQSGGKKQPRPPRLNDYKREQEKKKEGRRHENSYKYEREREKERERDGYRERDRDRDGDRDRDRHHHHHRDHDRDRDRRDRHRDQYDRDRRR